MKLIKGGPRYGRCPTCHRYKAVVNYAGDSEMVRIRTHKDRPPGVPMTELARLPACPGSRSLIPSAALLAH